MPPVLLLARRNQSPDAVRLRKSTLAHDAVAAAVSHKHHSIIRVGAGLIQFVHGAHSRLATEDTRNRNPCSPFFAQVFSSNIISGWATHHGNVVEQPTATLKCNCNPRHVFPSFSCVVDFTYSHNTRTLLFQQNTSYLKKTIHTCEYVTEGCSSLVVCSSIMSSRLYIISHDTHC